MLASYYKMDRLRHTTHTMVCYHYMIIAVTIVIMMMMMMMMMMILKGAI